MKIYRHDSTPRKYHLLWDSDSKAIILKIHRDCLKFIPHPLQISLPIVKWHIDDHGFMDDLFDSFSGDLTSETFGFNRSIQKNTESDKYLEFKASLPQIKANTGLTCKQCWGTGISQDIVRPGETCVWCKGSCKEQETNWNQVTALTSSLNLLFRVLDFTEETSAEEQQRVMISMITRGGRNNTAIGGYFGPELCDYISSNPPELHDPIVKNVTSAMMLVNSWMYLDNTNGYIQTKCSDKGIHLNVDRDACYANASFHGRKPGEWCEFSDHNVDNGLQQLTILAGIASLVGQLDLYITAR